MIDFVLVFRIQAGEEPRVRYSSLDRRGVRNLRSRRESLSAAYEALLSEIQQDGYEATFIETNWREILEAGKPFSWFFEREQAVALIPSVQVFETA